MTRFINPLALTVLIIGTGLGYYVHDAVDERCEKAYVYINAHVVCHDPPVIKKTGYAELQRKLETFIDQEISGGKATEVAIYFRDLDNGPVFGINETADFAPASLLKLPLALMFLTEGERNPSILETKLLGVQSEGSLEQHFPSSQKINTTQPYSVSELLRRMLNYSDNDAYAVLYAAANKDRLKETFLELGFIDSSRITDETLSVRRYAAIFRALYNSSYLNAELSERTLRWLSMSDFKQGLIAGVPEDVVVAHKFGERLTEDGVKQLHDCGIIYYPDNPYLLCVMTRGLDFDTLATIIGAVSQEVYNEVDARRFPLTNL
jgi:beta-lactamase class A